MENMELILQNKESFLISIPEIMEYAVQDELDMKWLKTIERNMILEATGVTNHENTDTPFGGRKLINSSVVEDGKDNFLMPCPRTTRKGKEKPAPRVSRTTRASTRTSYKRRPSVSGARKSIGEKRKTKRNTSVLDDSATGGGKRMTRSKVANVSVVKSSFLEDGEIVEEKRMTRNKATNVSTFVENETPNVVSVAKVLTSPAVNKNSLQTQSPEVLFSPCAPNSVKQHVEAFEELTSTLAPDSSKDKKKDSEPSTVGKQTSPSIISPVPNTVKPKVDSPMTSKSKFVKQKVSQLLEKSPKELCYEGNRKPEANDNSVIEDEMEDLENKTYQVGDNCDGAMEIDEEEVSDANQAKKAEEAENKADDEWISDDDHDEMKESSVKKNSRLFSRTPKAVKPVQLKVVEAAVGSCKALRSRKVQTASLDLPLALQKPVEIEVKEAKLKKKMEKEVEAMKRKEEIMKKRAEAAKRKREEKMAKVKRTREEQGKEHQDAKAKVRKGQEEKKKAVASPEPEVEPAKSSPPKVPTPHGDFNATFEVKVDAYNLTPCWWDRPPVQPDNPNDYGMVDKSDCSSEEDNDPRKKIPVWAQLKPDDRKLLSQALLPHSLINEYWHCKPRAPTIKEFFGSQVSKRTLKRGLNYRTSSACWNTPPSRKLGL